jgi:S4 domain protein YaaA
MKECGFMEKIEISSEFITLGQFLKLANIVYSGGIVKVFLEENKISVNGVSENRRGKKLYPGDKISIKKIGEYRIVQNDR